MSNTNNILLEYIWLDSKNNLRYKTKEMDLQTISIDNLPIWNYDGSSTGQALGSDSEVFLKPTVIFNDPFRTEHKSYLVWCDMLNKNMAPLTNSTRCQVIDIFTKFKDEEPWFGIEQEYFIMNPVNNLPIGFTSNEKMEQQGKYYCSVGSDRSFGREIVEKHLNYCLKAGIKICGVNGEVAPGQWEYQIGPCVGIDAGDHVWMSRYILNRVAEQYGYNISYHPKPLGIKNDWNGSGCHTNFSTKKMREPNGINDINLALNRLSKVHSLHMDNYGDDNILRMSGRHETSSYNVFTVGRANRGASIRIPNMVLKDGCGYFEDRRPASNCDPYVVTSLILEASLNMMYDTIE